MAKTKFIKAKPATIDKLWKIKVETGGQPFDKIIDKLISEKYDTLNNGKKKQKGFPWQIK